MTEQIHCPKCDIPVPGENINIQELVAVCTSCNVVFGFATNTQRNQNKRRKFKQPDNLALTESDDQLAIKFWRREGREDQIGLGITSMLTLFLSIIFVALLIDEGPHPAMVILGAPWFVFLATAIAVLVNKTRLVLDDQTVSIESRPLPVFIPGEDWLFNEKSLLRDEIVRVFCEQTESSRKAGGMKRYYHVCAELPDGERVIMLKALPQNHAFYIAQEINAYLAETDEVGSIPTALIEADDSDMFDLDALIDGDGADDADLIFEEGEFKQSLE